MHKKFVSAASEGRRPCSRRLDSTHTRPNPTTTEALSDIGCRNGCSNGQSHITPIIFQNNLLLLHGSRSKRQQSAHQAVASLLYKKSILSPYDRPADSCQDTRCRQDRGGGSEGQTSWACARFITKRRDRSTYRRQEAFSSASAAAKVAMLCDF